jgi:hypothetical protein
MIEYNPEPTVADLISKSYPNPAAERGLAARYAPILQFDAREPFLPLVVGYTVFRAGAPSPSFPRTVELTKNGRLDTALAIEYAIWWDWDIGHLYELEHVWVYLDDNGRVGGGTGTIHSSLRIAPKPLTWYNTTISISPLPTIRC